MAAESSLEWDIAIVGSGFAGALIAHELGKGGKKVVVLEAGHGVPPNAVPPNINDYMERFYKASAKVPESPYPPEVFKGGNLNDPGGMEAGRPTVMSLSKGDFGNWKDPKQSYLIQKGPLPFASTYNRVVGGTSHWLGTCLRFVPADFRMKTRYGKSVPQFVDWPLRYSDLNAWYCRAEEELGVSANVADQGYLDVKFPEGYKYPMPEIPDSLFDRAVEAALSDLGEDKTEFLEMGKPLKKIPVRRLPAARNSQPYKQRRACAGNTNCIPICPIQAKYDPTITLNEAANTGNVTIMDRTVACEIIVGGDGRVSEIKYIRYSPARGSERQTGSVKAKVYVIAANAIETPRLLLMSKNEGRTPNGVANSSDMVGRNLMDHPYYVAWALMPEGKRVFPYRGPLITSGVGDLCDGPFRNERGAFRIDLGNEGWNFVVGGDPNITTADFVNGANRTGLNKRSERKALFGEALVKELNEKITRQCRIGFLVEQTPDRTNQVKLSEHHKDGLGLPRPEVSYNLSDYTKKGIVAAYRMSKLLFEQLGAEEFTRVGKHDACQYEEMIDGRPVTVTYTGAGHIMGTYRMGSHESDSVVNADQRSWDHDNLFLVGSGTFPTGATANPTLTIAALALRTADVILKNDLR